MDDPKTASNKQHCIPRLWFLRMCATRSASIPWDSNPQNTNKFLIARDVHANLSRSRLMQRIIVPLPFPSVTSSYPWLRETFDIILLSKNLSWQDVRHSQLDDDRRNDSMDRRSRISTHISMRHKFQCLLGDTSRKPRVMPRPESPSGWIRCDRCLCRSCHTGATYTDSQYFGVLSPSKSNAPEGMAFADACPAKACRLSSATSRLDVSIRKSTLEDSSSY